MRRYSSGGTPYFKWLEVGMPRITDTVRDCVFFLYPNRRAAELGKPFGGCGFLVQYPSTIMGRPFLYGVTNAHLIANNPIMRINRRDSPDKPDIFQIQDIDWEVHPDSFDVAATPLVLDSEVHDVSAIPHENFASPERSFNLGLGDEVFMVGRFVDHDGGTTNSPSVRFGNIAVMPTPMKQRGNVERDSYLIDLHSRTGFSGSPVFVYRTIGGDLDSAHKNGGNIDLGEPIPIFQHLLGIHWSQFKEWHSVYKNKADEDEENPSRERSTGWAKTYSGMTCVIPAKHILEVLNLTKFQQQRAKSDAVISETPQ